MYVVAQSVMFSTPNSPQKEPNVIQATLIFDLPSPTPEIPVEVTKQETLKSIESKEELPVAETYIESKITPISEPQTQTPSTTVQPEERPQEAPKQDDKVNNIFLTDKNITLTSRSEIRTPATDMARRHLSSFQQQQQNKVAEQASRYYQRHKNSPVIDNKIQNYFMSEDEKLRDSLKVRADCSSTSKKTTTIILGFLGGQIDCSKPPTIEGFIQNRINKSSHLSEQSRQEEKKRPQSIIIKD